MRLKKPIWKKTSTRYSEKKKWKAVLGSRFFNLRIITFFFNFAHGSLNESTFKFCFT
jgi:hypothetical protein